MDRALCLHPDPAVVSRVARERGWTWRECAGYRMAYAALVRRYAELKRRAERRYFHMPDSEP